METTKSRFDNAFTHWNICLPPEDVASRRRGKICQRGWAIWYLFGEDEGGEFLDYYAAHRMTSDRHRRLYADGTTVCLPALREFHQWSQDEERNRVLLADYFSENQRTLDLLEKKGFGVTGEEPGGVLINRALRLGALAGAAT